MLTSRTIDYLTFPGMENIPLSCWPGESKRTLKQYLVITVTLGYLLELEIKTSLLKLPYSFWTYNLGELT